MCWQCEEIDRHVAECRELMDRANDPRSQRGLIILIEQAVSAKQDLHPDEPLKAP
jgi:hypothetical protein